MSRARVDVVYTPIAVHGGARLQVINAKRQLWIGMWIADRRFRLSTVPVPCAAYRHYEAPTNRKTFRGGNTMLRNSEASSLFSRARACTLGVLLAAVASVYASPVVANLDVQSGGITLSATAIDFTAVPATGLFAPLTSASTADINFAAPSAANFITFAAAPGVSITLTGISGGAYSSASCFSPPAPGQTCTPVGSGLSLVNTPTGATASITVQGNLVSATGTTTPVTGIYTLQFADTNYQSVLATLLGGGSISTSYSAEFASTANDRLTLGGSVALSSTGLDFASTATVGGASSFVVSASSTGVFAPLTGTNGTALDLTSAAVAAGVPVNVIDFLTFLADPALHGDLTLLYQGVFFSSQCGSPAAVGQTCSLAGSPFMLSNVDGGSTVSFDISGNLVDGLVTDSLDGLFSLQFAGLTYQQVLATVAARGSVSGVYSASFASAQEATVPEPATVLLLAVGLLLVVSLRPNRRNAM